MNLGNCIWSKLVSWSSVSQLLVIGESSRIIEILLDFKIKNLDCRSESAIPLQISLIKSKLFLDLGDATESRAWEGSLQCSCELKKIRTLNAPIMTTTNVF